VPPRDGEGTPPGNDDELLAKVIPLRRRGTDPAEPQILADEPRGVSDPPEDPPALIEWSIWEPPPAELNWRERKPPALKVLADEPGGVSDPQDPPAPGEWSIWDPSPPPLRRRQTPEAAGSAGARAVGPHVRRRPASRFIGAMAVAAGTITAAAALAVVALERPSGPASQRASSGLQASRPSSTGLAKSAPSPPHRSTAARAGSHRRPAGRTAKTTSTAPKLAAVAAVAAVGGVPGTVQYRAPTGSSPTPTSASSPPAESTPAPKGASATASASHEFGFEP
jgi:hypothetical protein